MTRTLIVPMVGLGTRMKEHSEKPKPLIIIAEKPMFYWAVDSAMSVKKFDELVFCYKESEQELFSPAIKNLFPKARHQIFKNITNGQAETIYLTVLDANSEFSVIDSDVYFESISLEREPQGMNWCQLLWAESENPNHSFIEITNSKVRRIVEKDPISKNGVVGFYSFSSKKMYDLCYESISSKEERYISKVIDLMIQMNIEVVCNQVTRHLSFGTYNEYIRDSKVLERIKCIQS